jgi:hypothetical protein
MICELIVVQIWTFENSGFLIAPQLGVSMWSEKDMYFWSELIF